MKIVVANSSKQSIGGGWSFIANFKKGMGADITENYDESDIYFIPSASMVSREEVKKAKDDGKTILLRVDNVLRNSRNRNTGMTRMKDFAQWADLVIYQSQWAKEYLNDFLEPKKSVVILNSIDEEIFNVQTEWEDRSTNFLYSRYNRDETKNWEMARYIYSGVHKASEKEINLYITGQFSQELINGNFDFYADEKYEYLGVIQEPSHMAKIYNQSTHFIFTYFNDACSNTLIEALCCGVQIVDVYGMIGTGGSIEIYKKFKKRGAEHFKLDRMIKQYRKAISKL